MTARIASRLRASISPGCAFAPRPRTAPELRHAFRAPQQTRQYGRFNYNRFQATKGFVRQWAQSPNFYYQITGIGATGGAFYVYNLEEVPISGRKRFNVISNDYLEKISQESYRECLQEAGSKLLPDHDPRVRQVERILQRLIPHTGLSNVDWKVHVVDEDQENAFVIPGGKVFVYTGIMKVTQDDDGLAVVLGHELAHNVANHAAEKISSGGILMAVGYLVSFVLGVGDFGLTRLAIDFGFNLPNGRKQESEADFIGLQIMSEACYDPEAAIGVWERMGKLNTSQAEVPQFMSTHPANANRLQNFKAWLPAAEMKREASGCPALSHHVKQFKGSYATWGKQDQDLWS